MKTSLQAVAHVAVYLVALPPVSFLVCVIFTFQEAYELLVFFILWCIQSDVDFPGIPYCSLSRNVQFLQRASLLYSSIKSHVHALKAKICLVL